MKTLINFSIILLSICITSNVVFGQSENDRILEQIRKHLNSRNHTKNDLAELAIKDKYYSKDLDLTHVYVQQNYMDIPIQNAMIISAFRGRKLIHFNSTFVKNISVDSDIMKKIIAPEEGLRKAMTVIGKENQKLPGLKSSMINKYKIKSQYIFGKGKIAKKEIGVSLIWIKSKSGLRLCWQSEIDVADSHSDWLMVQIDALSGEYLDQHNKIINCQFDHTPFLATNKRPLGINSYDLSLHTLSNGYRVFDLPLESPSHGSRTLTSDPWQRGGVGNPAATLGWHNDGNSNYNITRGNNVYAYEDEDGNNVPGYSPDGGSSLIFDFNLDFSLSPVANRDASISNLFHTCNLTHDILYQYGFDEAAGNFQNDNLGRGGTENDPVLAEALDGAGINNANFSVVEDGISGRMQMFLWSGSTSVNVTSPANISGLYNAVAAGFGPSAFDISGTLVEANDGTANPSEACSSLINGAQINGNIALIDRGNCEFGTKILNAQNSGAIAAIVCNNVSGSPITMAPGLNGGSVTIPSVMLSQGDCQTIRAELPGVEVTLNSNQIDGAFDNGIIVHEYGHGVSTRLTGGPSSPYCLINDEQMGEGWSDYLGLMLTTDWSTAQATESRGIGTYAISQPPSGNGIRAYPYTTDMNINPFTYNDIAAAPIINGNVSPHYVGSVWATMLWEMTWEIIAMESVDTDIYHGKGGNNVALQLVMNGMKLQPCSPGFVDGRDAILLADELLYNGKYKCAIWSAFAKRGLGLSASQQSSDNHTDGIEAFDLPDGIQLNSGPALISGLEGEVLTVTTEAICNCSPLSNFQIKEPVGANYEVLQINNGVLSGNDVVSNIVNLNPGDTMHLSYDIRPRLCKTQYPDTILYDNVEASDQFINPLFSSKQWVKNSTYFSSSTNSWKAENFSTMSDISLISINDYSITDNTYFSFLHRFETEEFWDGGVVEYSDDNGITWKDLGPYFIYQGYPSNFAAIGSTALVERPGFTGSSSDHFGSNAFVKSIIDLSSFSGQNIKIRFRFVSDSNTSGGGINGWYIDDVFLTKLYGLSTVINAYENGLLINDTSRFINVTINDQSIVFVDPIAGGNKSGGSWPDGFTNLQDALTLAGCRSIDSIWLAEGKYLPYESRDTSFSLLPNLTIKGGFSGGGANRNPSVYHSILSGDIGIIGNVADNSYHVIMSNSLTNNTVIDGVIIEEGNADGLGIHGFGSAILNYGDVTLKNTTLRNNLGGDVLRNESGKINIKDKVIIQQ